MPTGVPDRYSDNFVGVNVTERVKQQALQWFTYLVILGLFSVVFLA
jgi:hypothetical protein